ADWEYVLGVNLLNPHGFHYTLEGPRKRDWPPSMFYQYPWWHFYGAFSNYMSRLSHMLTGGRHVAKVAMLWPINTMFATYMPQHGAGTPVSPLQTSAAQNGRIEGDFNVLTDLLLRLHYDFDYLDEDILAGAELLTGGERPQIGVRDERFELLILPPMVQLKLSTLERLEQFVAAGGRVLGMIFLPDRAFGPDGLVDIRDRIQALFGVDPAQTQRGYRDVLDLRSTTTEHPSGGTVSFLASYALQRQLPLRIQKELGAVGRPEHAAFLVEPGQDANRYFYTAQNGEREEITAEVLAERAEVAAALEQVLGSLIAPDVVIDNPEIFYLHRVKDGTDLYFLINPTFTPQSATVTIAGRVQPLLWDPSTGAESPILPARDVAGGTSFRVDLGPTGSAFVVAATPSGALKETRILDTDLVVESIGEEELTGYTRSAMPYLVVAENGGEQRLDLEPGEIVEPLHLDGEWEFRAEDENALIISHWLATAAEPGEPIETYTAAEAGTSAWLPMVPGAWSYQLPAEPDRPYPIDVWYRASFEAAYVPPPLSLIVDGFACAAWRLWVNGKPVEAPPR
ncbi:MAG TPA: hypothetical protein VEZ12_07360, partial [Herpetosiphonaceae bacterium]|nr:hypothetical protein [Herpetosiphonaceae bacterium]